MVTMVGKEKGFDTDDEYYFSLWLEELKEAGYVDSWSREPYELKLTDGLQVEYFKETKLKTKIKVEKKLKTILRPSIYTPDFEISWNEKSHKLLFQLIRENSEYNSPFYADYDTYVSLVELKPSFDSGNMTRLFKNNQKFIWDKFKIYINLIEDLGALFAATFTPNEYLLTPKTKKLRKLNYTPRTLEQFLNL